MYADHHIFIKRKTGVSDRFVGKYPADPVFLTYFLHQPDFKLLIPSKSQLLAQTDYGRFTRIRSVSQLSGGQGRHLPQVFQYIIRHSLFVTGKLFLFP